jgi:hypothetical protein
MMVNVLSGARHKVPRLRIIVREANDDSSLGMTGEKLTTHYQDR